MRLFWLITGKTYFPKYSVSMGKQSITRIQPKVMSKFHKNSRKLSFGPIFCPFCSFLCTQEFFWNIRFSHFFLYQNFFHCLAFQRKLKNIFRKNMSQTYRRTYTLTNMTLKDFSCWGSKNAELLVIIIYCEIILQNQRI